jgi:integrase
VSWRGRGRPEAANEVRSTSCRAVHWCAGLRRPGRHHGQAPRSRRGDSAWAAGGQSGAPCERRGSSPRSTSSGSRAPRRRSTSCSTDTWRVLDVDPNTAKAYRGYIENHIRPVLAELSVGRVNGEMLDSFYAELRRCRVRCRRGQELIDQRTKREHACDARCRPHVCKPLAAATVRQIHWILSGAFDRGVRWRWLSVTPVQSAEPPSPPVPKPDPPSPEEAARILNEAWKDLDWGLFLWLAMTVGASRRAVRPAARPCRPDEACASDSQQHQR